MATTIIEQSTAANSVQKSPSLLGYAIYCEIMKILRLPGFIIPSLVFPTVFFLIMGLPNQHAVLQGVRGGAYILISFGGFATMSVGFLNFCISLSQERTMKWDRLLRVTPLNPFIYMLAKMVTTLLVGFLSLLVFLLVAVPLTHVSLPWYTWIELMAILLSGMLPFIALGFLIGYLANPNAATAIANILYLLLSFASGLFVPLPLLPDFVRTIAPYLPGYHVGYLGHALLGVTDGMPLWSHIVWVVAYTIVFTALALFAYRYNERKQFS
jgi:ABC-2 type transport system permease protein